MYIYIQSKKIVQKIVVTLYLHTCICSLFTYVHIEYSVLWLHTNMYIFSEVSYTLTLYQWLCMYIYPLFMTFYVHSYDSLCIFILMTLYVRLFMTLYVYKSLSSTLYWSVHMHIIYRMKVKQKRDRDGVGRDTSCRHFLTHAHTTLSHTYTHTHTRIQTHTRTHSMELKGNVIKLELAKTQVVDTQHSLTHIHKHTHTHRHTHTHTHTHKHTHTHTTTNTNTQTHT